MKTELILDIVSSWLQIFSRKYMDYPLFFNFFHWFKLIIIKIVLPCTERCDSCTVNKHSR